MFLISQYSNIKKRIVTGRSNVLGSLSCSNGDFNTICISLLAMFRYYFVHYFDASNYCKGLMT